MKNILHHAARTVILALCMPLTTHSAPDPAAIAITVRADRPEALYRCGERAEFRIAVSNLNPAAGSNEAIAVALSLDGERQIEAKTFPLSALPVTLGGTLKEPGFLRCAVSLRSKERGNVSPGYGSAGFEPEKIKPAAIMPADFDAFWEQSRRELEDVPPDVRLTPDEKYSNNQRAVFAVSFANIANTRVYGYLGVPKGPPPFPAIVSIPSAGVGKPREPYLPFSDKALCLVVGVHDLAHNPDSSALESYNRRYPRYPIFGAPDRDKYFFRRAILGADRAIRWLAARPDFDGKHLVVNGSSQGGGFSLIMAGLNTSVTAIAASVPALCDHAGETVGRSSGWPRIVKSLPPAEQARALEMSAYFDAVNFARKIDPSVAAIVAVGFIDTTCCPSSVYAAFNTLRGPKRIFNGPLTGHGSVAEFSTFQSAWMQGQLGLGQTIPPAAGH